MRIVSALLVALAAIGSVLLLWSFSFHRKVAKRRAALEAERTERTRVDEALRESEKKFRALFDQSNDAIFIHDDRGHMLDVNRRAMQMLGYTRDELLAMPTTEHHPPEALENAIAAFEELIMEGHVRFDSVFRKKDGTSIDVSLSVSLVDPESHTFQAVVRDITERNRSERALRDANWKLESIIEATHIGTWEWNVQTGETVFNDIWAQIVGYTLDELAPVSIGTWETLAHPDDLKLSAELLERHFAGQLPYYDCDCRIKHKDGRWVWVHERGRVVTRTPEGKPLMMFGIHSDITERKWSEQAVEELNASLESRVAERTAQLEYSNRELDAFTNSVSHDLRAPLHTIDSFTRFLEEDFAEQLGVEGKRLLEVIRKNTDRMDQLIRDMLKLSRVTSEELNYSRVEMSSLASSVCAEAAPPDVLATFEIALRDLPDVHGDPSLLNQVWFNLISNAVKYSMKAPVRRIEIGGHAENGMATYYVKDKGIGYDPEYSDKLFGVFQRLHSAEDFEGTGIGLAIVQRIVARHGGRTWAEGKLDEGATFWFSLPARWDPP